MEDSKRQNLESYLSEQLEDLKVKLECLTRVDLDDLRSRDRAKLENGSYKLNKDLDSMLERLDLTQSFSEQLDGLKERLEWLTSEVKLQDLTFWELVKLESRSSKFNEELGSVLERLGM